MLLSNIGLDGGLVELGSLTSLGFPIILGRKKFKNHLKVEWVADDCEIPAKFDASVARKFLSKIADFTPIYRQIRQVFGPKSRKIRQILAIILIIVAPIS